MGRKGPSSGRRGPAKEKRDPELFSESDDEQIIDDAFAQGKGKVKLGGGGEDSDEIDEEAVYDLSDSDEESGSDEGDEEDEDDGEPDLDEEIERGGRAGRLAKQAKYLEERLKLQQKEDEDEGPSEGEDAEEEARERLWGTSKGAYYGGDDAEAVSDEEDALKGEEEEAVRLQAQRAARLDDDDYGLGHDVMGGGAGAGPSQHPPPSLCAPRCPAGSVLSDFLSPEERMSALLADAPELTSLLAELQASLAERPPNPSWLR
ncbi:hypothetical protein MNEG_11561 [Monoraphidium neglectum]|uniref:Uncharacterized protein n=1 Tax=Monoraphidium neglectum TaxID=145388 RepID=A0A0D2LYC2_9CHLO|nr:hypothetical protein MNEG_11561 [Monoraphidium neglectum]KIY96399.1 hypothetical protein MNEG_11561 [Monoraphidium neglectum]|eukprot:XP_013895419.1 hypothetical protein MNEG_11561 [Monoraphidium neglectum]